jgi:hypothetical protein
VNRKFTAMFDPHFCRVDFGNGARKPPKPYTTV